MYLVDHESYRAPEEFRVRMSDIDRVWAQNKENSPFASKAATEEEQERVLEEAQSIIDFQDRVFKRAGLSDNGTFLPPSIHPALCDNKPKTDLASAYVECKQAVCGAVEGLLQKTGLQPSDVDILVTTCSIYCPTPSMASMVVNHFKMRSDIESYHLGGMGCANGVVAVNMVKDLLAAHPDCNAILATNECTTPAFYTGQDKSRLVTNVLFRMGASAVLLSNKRAWAGRAKYSLQRALRVHTGAGDAAYRCIWYGPDEKGINGVSLGTNVVNEATRAMTAAMTQVAPSIMTWQQIAAYLASHGLNRAAKALGASPLTPRYTPCFREGVQHFLLHAGGAKVLDGMGKSLKLEGYDLQPSRMVLHDYGNVSSSTTWYTLGFIESVRGVRKGDKVLQVGVGSGIKCGINVWKAVRDIDSLHNSWEHRVDDERAAAVSVANANYSWRGQTMRRIFFMLVCFFTLALMYMAMTSSSQGTTSIEGRVRELSSMLLLSSSDNAVEQEL